MLSIIVAKSKNNVIGYKNKLVWNLAEDMKRFKEITEGHTVIMGRKTYESIGKTLENRENILMERLFLSRRQRRWQYHITSCLSC